MKNKSDIFNERISLVSKKNDANYFNNTLTLIKLLLTAYFESTKKEHPYDSYYMDVISHLLLNIVNENERESNNENPSIYWIKFVLAGLYYYNESELIEIFASDKVIEMYIYIIDSIIAGKSDRIISLIAKL